MKNVEPSHIPDKPELLSPAGDMECLEAALRFGADAVYIGGPMMQLRSGKVGFDADGIKTAAAKAHAAGKKLYVAANAFMSSGEIDLIPDYADMLKEAGADAVIVSDIGALAAFKNAEPALSVHISTQANCCNYMAARMYGDLGASRVILARELSLEDIAEMHAKIPSGLELEAFVHGAMCMAYSGRCLISAFLNGRSANKGECTQPCRWQYYLMEKTREGQFIPIEQTCGGAAILSSQDLCCIDFLDKIRDAGVCSFKIEGRMKTPYYVATATNAYRNVMDGTASPSDMRSELEAVSHRPYSEGFYFGQMRHYDSNNGAYTQSCLYAAKVIGREGDMLAVEQRGLFSVGDELEIVAPGITGRGFTVSGIFTAEGEKRERANHAAEKLFINCPYPLREGDMLRRRLR